MARIVLILFDKTQFRFPRDVMPMKVQAEMNVVKEMLGRMLWDRRKYCYLRCRRGPTMLSYPGAYFEEEIWEIINDFNFLKATVCFLLTAKAKVYILALSKLEEYVKELICPNTSLHHETKVIFKY